RTGADTGTGDDATGPASRQVQPQGEEPDLPMQLPHQQPPQQPQYDPETPRGYTRVGHLFADEKGNIVTKDGRVMAPSGEAARHWSNMSTAWAEGTTS